MTDQAARPTALVVIDVQNDVMADAWEAEKVVARIARLIQRARDAAVPVVYVQHEDEGMLRGSEGWQLVDAIAPQPGDAVVAKRFPDSFADTTLGETLRDLGVRHVVMAGAQTDVCIRTTTLRTLVEGYDLTLVEDCHTTEDAGFDLADGEKVPISAKQIVAHTNLCLWNLTYPDVTATIAPHDTVAFT